jgi:hypothetical protein
MEALEREGIDEDVVFELAIAAALGAAHTPLQAALRALNDKVDVDAPEDP